MARSLLMMAAAAMRTGLATRKSKGITTISEAGSMGGGGGRDNRQKSRVGMVFFPNILVVYILLSKVSLVAIG